MSSTNKGRDIQKDNPTRLPHTASSAQRRQGKDSTRSTSSQQVPKGSFVDPAFAERGVEASPAAAVERIERGQVEAGLPPLSWYDVLLELAAAPECRLRMHELARAVVLSRSGLARLVDRLEKAGLLRREPDPQDGRGSFAVLTDEGARMRERMWPVYAQGIAEHFGAHVTNEEAEVLTRALGRVRAAAGSS